MPQTKAPTSSVYQALDIQPLKVNPQTPLNEVIHLMTQASAHCHIPLQNRNSLEPSAMAQHTDCVLVMDNHQLVGILTEKDIVRLSATNTTITGRTAAEAMTHPVRTLAAEEDLDIYSALSRMHRHNIHHLPVVEAQGEVIGLVTPERLRSLMKPADFMRFRLVQEVMKTEVIHALTSASMMQIVHQMLTHQVSCVVIVDAPKEQAEGQVTTEPATTEQVNRRQANALVPIGIVTERDVVRVQRLGLDLKETQVQDLMSAPLFLASPQDSLWEVDKIMRAHKVRRLVVADTQGRLAGIITQSSLLPVNPTELYQVLELLQDQVGQLEQQNAELLQRRNQELKSLVAQKVSRLQRREETLRNLALGVGTETGEDFWRSLVTYLTEALQMDYAVVGKLEGDSRVQTLAAYGDGQVLPNFSYSLEGTPCEDVVTRQVCVSHQAVQQQYPQDQMLKELQVESYLGTPLRNTKGQVEGLLVVMSHEPRTETGFLEEVLSIFAVRASTEIERQKMAAEQQSFFSLPLDLTCIASLDDGHFKRLNPAFEETLGYSTNELLSKPFLEFVHPEDKAATKEVAAQLLTGTLITAFENRYRCKDGSYRWLLWAATAVPEQRSIYATARDITERKEMERTLQDRIKQQMTVAELGQIALSLDDLADLDELMNAAAIAVAQTLDVDYCKVLELLPDGESLLLKAGVGWQPGLVGNLVIGTECSSQAGYTLRSDRPVVVADLRTETRFSGPELLSNHNVVSGMSVIIFGQQQPYGILSAHTTQLRSFSDEDTAFLQSVANLLAQAIEQKHAQAIVVQSEQDYRTLAENLPGMVYRVFPDQQWRMMFLNNQCQTLTGFTQAELQGGEVCSIDSLIVPEDRPQVIEVVRAGVAQQTPFQVEYRIRDKARDIRYFWEKGQPIAANNGQPAHIDGVIFDITNRKLAQQRIEEQAALLDVATDAIFVYSLSGEILFWNKGAEAIYGWSAEEALSQNVYQLLYPEDSQENEVSLERLAPTGSWQGELQQITQQKQIITVMSRWTLMKDQQGNPKSILSVDTDITEAKQLEAQFLRAQRLESVGTLASGIAHDLNNILTPIYGVAQLLSMQLPDADDPIRQQLQLLKTSAKQGSRMVNQVLSFARGKEGDRAPLAIKHLIVELRNFATQTFPKSLTITANIPNDLRMVNADATHLYQALMNLLVNARDAMPNGGQLTLSAVNLDLDEAFASSHIDASVGPYLLITVSDNGVGIPADQLDRIFEPFFSTKQSIGGTGLGLSTVHGIVKNHDGFVTVYSEVGKGTQFKIYLPAIESTDTNEDTVSFPSGNGELLLVVDDDKPICDVAKIALEKHNYQVLVAEGGIEAIAKYTEHKADIEMVLLDMTMPDLDGSTAIRILRQINPNLKIIAVSGLPGNERVAAALGDSIKAFLPKPYSAAVLLQTVHEIIERE
ncbi:PAS fold family [Synechococcus sp. PCC 7335]|nr:PAS fold family [Synechococcus sp. PCC 7335]